jgi:fucose 4-O-acetylase-like acetyltransferase
VHPLRRLSQVAESTPVTRDRYVDLLRALAITLVVLGHWLITVITTGAHHRPSGHSALDSLRWAYPTTWLFQVMPVFFVVGGYANAASLSAHRRRGGDAVGWLLDRAGRLVRPTTALLLVLAAGSVAARLVGADAALVRTAVWVASIPLWFLSAYLVVVLLTPVMYRLHERFGAAVPAVLVALVSLGDVARFTGAPALAGGSYLFGWLAIHQVGFFWRDGRLRFTRRSWVPPLVGGAAALVLLTVVGPYPITMIDVTGERIKNASPPTLALLAAATTQVGLIMLLHDPAERWLRRRRPWLVVVAANSVVLTVFLWHMTAVLVLIGVLWWAHLLPTPGVGTADWWLWRLPWLVLLTVVLAGFVAVFGRLESGSHRAGRLPFRPPPWLHRPLLRLILTVTAFAAVVIALLVNNIVPPDHPELTGVPVGALAAYLAGALVLRLLSAVQDGLPRHV